MKHLVRTYLLEIDGNIGNKNTFFQSTFSPTLQMYHKNISYGLIYLGKY
ncbi:Uncharacterised protein [Bartonella grahamii]|uniref:Uncharacterized protein n=1 Tax=Bartonella grahamii TaxID=33045 RepID=A0A336NN10_BARGR|nr:Uncharacterised protein [Bartonella grahamii]